MDALPWRNSAEDTCTCDNDNFKLSSLDGHLRQRLDLPLESLRKLTTRRVADIGSYSESSTWRYLSFQLSECKDLGNYEAGDFHPVHLGADFDARHRVVQKLGLGDFSTASLLETTLQTGGLP